MFCNQLGQENVDNEKNGNSLSRKKKRYSSGNKIGRTKDTPNEHATCVVASYRLFSHHSDPSIFMYHEIFLFPVSYIYLRLGGISVPFLLTVFFHLLVLTP